jgi:hypothetical protein
MWRGQGTAGFCQGKWVAERRGTSSIQALAPGGPIYNYARPGYRATAPRRTY